MPAVREDKGVDFLGSRSRGDFVRCRERERRASTAEANPNNVVIGFQAVTVARLVDHILPVAQIGFGVSAALSFTWCLIGCALPLLCLEFHSDMSRNVFFLNSL